MASEKVDFEYPQKVFQKHIFLQNDKKFCNENTGEKRLRQEDVLG